MLVTREPANAIAQISSVWSLRLKNNATRTRPANPYAPSTSPYQSRAACTKPKTSSHALRFCSRRRAVLAGVPAAT